MDRGPLESETCADVVLPALRSSGWEQDQIVEQYLLENPDSEHAPRDPYA